MWHCILGRLLNIRENMQSNVKRYNVRLNCNKKKKRGDRWFVILDILEESDYVFFIFVLEKNAFKNLDMHPRPSTASADLYNFLGDDSHWGIREEPSKESMWNN